MRTLPLALCLPFLAACRVPPTDPAEPLLAADRAFAADTAARRLDGWLAAFAPAGSVVGDDDRPRTGSEAIRAHMAAFFADAANELVWTPEEARISESGRLGTTTGRWELRRRRADGGQEVVRRGRYFDVWQRQPDGSWRLLYDTGDPDGATDTAR